MDFQRIILFLIFSFSTLLLWEAWQRAQEPPQPAVAQTAAQQATGQQVAAQQDVPAALNSPAASTAQTPAPPAATQLQSGQKIKVTTDFLRVEIDTVGGDLRHLELLRQYDKLDRTKPMVLLQEKGDHTYVAQTGLLGSGLPTHHTVFTAESSAYELAQGEDKLSVRLTTTVPDTARVTKTYTFHRSSYLIDVSYEIENIGGSALTPAAYFQLIRDENPPAGDTVFVPTYTGPAIYTEQDKFQKVTFSDIEEGKAKHTPTANNGWVGMLQHYFVSAWLPGQGAQREFYTKHLQGDLYSVGMVLPVESIAPGQTAKLNVPLYSGPAMASLDEVTPGLGLTVDYGWLTIIATPIFWLLSWLHGWVGNWGIAIILLTVLIKLAFWPLSAASYRSMAKMRVVAPKLEKIKQQYGDDRERLHKAMMELYKTEKINPLGGCLPVLIQIPVFIALYWAILASVELRYAPFFGWITDLSATDPYYVLPVIMGISMYIQTKLNPTPPDPLQAKLMQIMPIAFSVVFFFFPAGLVLYSIVNNILSIAQQWVITRNLQAEYKGAGKNR